MSNKHGIVKCKVCKTTISQCRCISPNKEIKYGICDGCKGENPITKFLDGLVNHIEAIEDEYVKEMTVVAKDMQRVLRKYKKKGIDPNDCKAKLFAILKNELEQ